MIPYWNSNQLPAYSYVYMPLPISNLSNFPNWFYNSECLPNLGEISTIPVNGPFQQNFSPQFVMGGKNTVMCTITNVPPSKNTLIPDEEERKKIKLIRKLQNRPKTYLTEKRIYLAARQKEMMESPRRLRSTKQRKQSKKLQKEFYKNCQTPQLESMRQSGIEEKIGKELKSPASVAPSSIQIEEMEGGTRGSCLPLPTNLNGTSQPNEIETQQERLFIFDV